MPQFIYRAMDVNGSIVPGNMDANNVPDLELRLLAPDDAEELAALIERNRQYLREWLPWVDSSRTAAELGIRNLLSGWGGDELAAFNGRGYLASLFRNGHWRSLQREISLFSRRYGGAAGKKFFELAVMPWLLTMLGFLLVVTYWPGLTLWLPHPLMK